MSSRRDDPKERAELWSEAVRRGGVSLDAEPCGSIDLPSVAREVSEREAKSIIVVQSKRDCQELLSEFLISAKSQERGLAAAVYPSRTGYDPATGTGNCGNYAEVKQAEDFGLAPHAAVCRRCKLRGDCEYITDMARARNSAYGIMTGSRAEYTHLEAESGEANALILINDRPVDVLKPHAKFKLDRGKVISQLEAIVASIRRTRPNVLWSDKRSFDESTIIAHYFDALCRFAEAIRSAVQEGGRHSIPIPDPVAGHRDAQQILFGSFAYSRLQHDGRLFRVCSSAAAGTLEALVIKANASKAYFSAVWRTRSPRPATIVYDPSQSVDAMTRALGIRVQLIEAATPPTTARQVIDRCTAQKRPTATAKLISGFLAVYGSIGVIADKGQAEAIRCLTDPERDAVRLIDWKTEPAELVDCPMVLVLGFPPVDEDMVLDRLAQDGHASIAASDPGWGPLPWARQLPNDEIVTVKRMGYANKHWQEARQRLILGRLGRVLANLPMPSFVVSDEALGLQIVDGPPELDRDEVILLGLIRGDFLKSASEIPEDAPGSPISDALLRKSPKPLSAKILCQQSGCPMSSVYRKLDKLKKAGLIDCKRGEWFATDPRPKGGK